MDAAVETRPASGINVAIASDPGDPPGTFATARWSSTGHYLQTRPTGNGALLLMATLRNNTGGDVVSMNVNYDLSLRNTPGGEEVTPGHRVYYNLSGSANSWVPVGDFGTVGPVSIPLDFSATPWTGNTSMYLLFVDHNAATNPDGAYGIDNFAVSDVVGTVTTCVAITNQSGDISIPERGMATFSIMVTGTPQTIQWFRNDVAIPGANAATYSIASVMYPDDNNAQFHATVANSLCFVSSSDVTLTVLPDMDPPAVVSVIGELDPTQVTVTFSEPIVDTGPGGYVGNAVVYPAGGNPDGAEALVTFDAVLSPDGLTLTLTTTARADGVNYTIRLTQIYDASSQQNGMPDTFVPVRPTVLLIGFDVNNEWKYDINKGDRTGTGWEAVGFDDSDWPSGPSPLGLDVSAGTPPQPAIVTPLAYAANGVVTYFRKHFELPSSTNGLVLTLRDLVEDGAVYYLNGQEILRNRMPAGQVDFATFAVNAPEPTPPTGPFMLAITNLFPGDNVLAVEVHQSSAASSDLEFAAELAANIASYSAGPPSITAQPQSQTVNEGQGVTFAVVADGALPLAYQWRKGGMDIAGADGPTYTINQALPGDAGNYTVFVSNSLGSSNSAVAVLNVNADLTPPAFLSAVADTNLTNIALLFSERLDPANAENISHYRVHLTAAPGVALTIETAVLINGTNVILTTSPRMQSQDYTIALAGVTDTAVAKNPAAPSSRAVRSSVVILAPDDTTRWHFSTGGINLDGSGWQLPGYNDAAWPTGLAGFTTSNALEITTNGFELRTTNMVAPVSGGPPTAYYRVPFTFPGAVANAALHIVGVIDDGLVAYVNGVEAGRLRVTNASPVSFIDLTSAASPETTDVHLPLDAVTLTNLSGLVSGENLLAIELHQVSSTSSDAVLAIQLIAEVEQFGIGGSGPRLSVSRNPITGQVTITWSGGGILQQANDLPSGGVGWGDVPGNPPSPYTIAPAGNQMFFRVR